ncbi:alpha/beta hydrolase [Actinokineospora iranica]|uniref:S-formylglutathione hydrolase FrmB n=1 Tax=Actinokineospora iranica TaxID=1271860 RepID=A0A1G6Z9S1_9PSEU|nr:alpha/beta hydrolase family protein [Actinokineospora iranica]SDD99222.1 S-formylglutathione hydrolase FrmB [Actinokineospora iranica]
MTRLRPVTRWVAGFAVAAAVAVPLTIPSAQAAPSAVGITADDGARVVSETRIDARTVDLDIASPALGFNGKVRLLLPSNWDAQPTRTWPSLWLLHGCCEDKDYQSWTHFTDVEEFTANKDVLVVMPTDGQVGMYTSWWNFGGANKPDWETFHTKEVKQIVERGYRANDVRVGAGLSIGGYGALAYTFRHPGLFRAAASYSGIPNTMLWGVPQFINGIVVSEGLLFYALWGNEYLQRSIWTSRNPYDNVEAFRGIGLYVSCGDGSAGPLDKAGAFDLIEPVSLQSSKSFTDKLRKKGIPVTVNYYGKGTHSWPYWERELKNSWPVLAKGLGLPA